MIHARLSAKCPSLGGPDGSTAGENFPVGIENLDAVVLAVADIDILVRVDYRHVGRVELARTFAALAPLHQVFSVARELHHARIAVTIGDQKIAVR